MTTTTPTPHTALLAAAEALRIAAEALAVDAAIAFGPSKRHESAALADIVERERKLMVYRSKRYQPKEASE
jgi:hypothetical protein